MTSMDWSAPFETSLLQSGRQFLVRCMSGDDVHQLAAMLAEDDSALLEYWATDKGCCFRFSEHGHVTGHFVNEEEYDSHPGFRAFPRVTFYPDAVNLPDFDTSNPATLL